MQRLGKAAIPLLCVELLWGENGLVLSRGWLRVMRAHFV